MLGPLLERFRADDASVQYEVQRMTAQGGWTNFYAEYSDSDETAAFDEPQQPPEFGPDSGYPPGRYRCLERRDGRISEVVWTVESPDADEAYEHQRDRQRQRERLEELSYEEVLEAMAEGESFAPLRREELNQILDEKRKGGESTSSEPHGIIDDAIAGVLQQEEITDEEIERLQLVTDLKVQLESAKCGLCHRCQSSSNVERCPECGDLVCEVHRVPSQDICLECSG